MKNHLNLNQLKSIQTIKIYEEYFNFRGTFFVITLTDVFTT